MLLDELKLHEKAQIQKIGGSPNFNERLLSLGLYQDIEISKVVKSTGISLYYFNETFLAIRDFEAQMIEVILT